MKDAKSGVSEREQLLAAEALFRAMDTRELAMAYLRGSTYLWSDGRSVHVWVGDGDDGWKDSGWAVGVSPGASGVAIDQGAMDEYVMMRFAELIREGAAGAAAERALGAHHGNGGCAALEASWPDIGAQVGALER